MASEPGRKDIHRILERVKQKREDYIAYDFTRKKNDILKTFFDLAQEFDTLRDLYRICVAVPLAFMELESRLYLLDDSGDHLVKVCDSIDGLCEDKPPAPPSIRLTQQPYDIKGSYIVPIIRKHFRENEFTVNRLTKATLGMFEIYPVAKLLPADRFFFTKYTNRIGYNLHNRILDRQNIRHLKFINNLVVDIEHNVIIPNMYFKHLFRQLHKKIMEMDTLRAAMNEVKEKEGLTFSVECCNQMMARIASLQGDLGKYLEEIQKHHAHMSLFLESLFRRDHFQKGHLVLRPKKCLVDKEIIAPQLEHYQSRLKSRGISIERPQDMQQEEIPLMVDVGLLAQVYANLFSNAVKYTEAITDWSGTTRKAVAYGREYIPNHFGPGKDGVKFNVFTTGPRLSRLEQEEVFNDGFRREHDKGLPGTGHGLAFIKHVIEIHAGSIGYEPTAQGNNFFFVLPLPPQEPPENS